MYDFMQVSLSSLDSSFFSPLLMVSMNVRKLLFHTVYLTSSLRIIGKLDILTQTETINSQCSSLEMSVQCSLYTHKIYLEALILTVRKLFVFHCYRPKRVCTKPCGACSHLEYCGPLSPVDEWSSRQNSIMSQLYEPIPGLPTGVPYQTSSVRFHVCGRQNWSSFDFYSMLTTTYRIVKKLKMS